MELDINFTYFPQAIAGECPDWDPRNDPEKSSAMPDSLFRTSNQLPPIHRHKPGRQMLSAIPLSIEARLIWTQQLQKKFVDALIHMGVQYATPESVAKQMKVEGLTPESVATHLQTYQLYWKRTRPELPFDDHVLLVQDKEKQQQQQQDVSLVSAKSQRLVWDVLIHRTFVEALAQLGFNYSTPVKILELMNVKNLLLQDLISHMQRYQPYLMDLAYTSSAVVEQKHSEIPLQYYEMSEQSEILEEENESDLDWIHEADVDVGKCSLPSDDTIAEDALLYCALFPFDYEFDKDTLVQLWMAAGIIVKEPMEEMATMLFENFLTKGYFLLGKTNLVTGKVNYKFKADRSFLLPSLRSRGNHIVQTEGYSNLETISSEVSHMSIRCHSLKNFAALNGFKRFKQLRTMMFFQGHEMSIKQVPRDFFLSLGQLQVLDLRQTCLTQLPSSIGNMKYLRYLSLSETPIKYLPETIGCLKNLQTLKLRGCSNLFILPKDIKKLINLRHLEFDVLRQLRSMPQEVGALTNIRTLSAFLVGMEDGCSIRQLKSMNNLSGSFCISRLEHVLTESEAMEACLSKKTLVTKLELHWTGPLHENVEDYEKVVSSLRPYTSLEELQISCFPGLELSSWISDPAFSRLTSITLFECENCVLPSLGKLPSLKILSIINFHKLKVIDHNFHGGLGIPGYTAFPKLEKLAVENMFSLEEWTGIGRSDFPHLLELKVKHCPKLQSLIPLSWLLSLKFIEISRCTVLASCPDCILPTWVESLIIEECPLISARFLNDGGQDFPKLSHMPLVWIDHQETILGQRLSQEYGQCQCRAANG